VWQREVPGTKEIQAALPVYAVDSADTALSVMVAFGSLQYGEHPDMPGKPWYRVQWFGGELASIDELAGRIHKLLTRRKDDAC